MRLRRLGAGKAFPSAIDRLRGRGFVVAISIQAPSMISFYDSRVEHTLQEGIYSCSTFQRVQESLLRRCPNRVYRCLVRPHFVLGIPTVY